MSQRNYKKLWCFWLTLMWSVEKTDHLSDCTHSCLTSCTFTPWIVSQHCTLCYFYSFQTPIPHWSAVFASLSWLSSPWAFAPLVLEALWWQGYYEAIRDISRMCFGKEGLWIELMSTRVTLAPITKWIIKGWNNAKTATSLWFLFSGTQVLLCRYEELLNLNNLNSLVICSSGSYIVFNTGAGLLMMSDKQKRVGAVM